MKVTTALFRLIDEEVSRQTDSGPCALLSLRDVRFQPAPALLVRKRDALRRFRLLTRLI